LHLVSLVPQISTTPKPCIPDLFLACQPTPCTEELPALSSVGICLQTPWHVTFERRTEEWMSSLALRQHHGLQVEAIGGRFYHAASPPCFGRNMNSADREMVRRQHRFSSYSRSLVKSDQWVYAAHRMARGRAPSYYQQRSTVVGGKTAQGVLKVRWVTRPCWSRVSRRRAPFPHTARSRLQRN
jgi:hypothetical protein